MKPLPNIGGKSHTIGFRLDEKSRRVLEERAELFEQSAHELARQYVLESLMAGEERAELRQTVLALHGEIEELRNEFAHAVQVLLVSAGRIQPEQAEAWVEENFKTKHG